MSSGSWPRPLSPPRSCAPSTTRNTSTRSRSTFSPSWPDAWRRSRSPCCSRAAASRTSPSACPGSPTLELTGLATEPAVRLLSASLPEPIDPAAAAQIAAATGGNPLALIDLAQELSVRELTESGLADDPVPIGHHLEAFYLRQVRHLPPEVRLWLLIAAADSTGNLDLIDAAGQELDLPASAVDGAESAGLVALAGEVRFRHPLVRSAAYNAAPGAQRRRVHVALSVASAKLGLVEREAWHAAKATLGTDPEVADRLERVADLAGSRGGFASRAAVLTQASALTPHGSLKHARLVAASEAALASGAAQLSKTLLDDVDEDLLDPLSLGRLISTRASQRLFMADPALRYGAADMLDAARAFHGQDAALEQNALVKAFEYALPAERALQGTTLVELGERMRDGAEQRDGIAATILRGLSAHILLPYGEAVPVMREAVDTIRGLDPEGLLQYGVSSVALTTALWDADGPAGVPGAHRGRGPRHRFPAAAGHRAVDHVAGRADGRDPSPGRPVHRAGARAAPRDRVRRRARDQRGDAGLVGACPGSRSR